MLPEARALPDFQRTLMVDGQIQEYWFSVLWEHAFGETCLDWFRALTTHYDLTTEEASYFSKHHEADTMDHLDRKAHGAVTQTVDFRTRFNCDIQYTDPTITKAYDASSITFNRNGLSGI